MDAPPPRFACTLCGACCNRSPEVALAEAAALADVFVFRLMFRLYRVPRAIADQGRLLGKPLASKAFYERRRLLDACSVRTSTRRIKDASGAVEVIEALVLSALPLDLPAGACAARQGSSCGIYPRRPVSCRSVPLHYSTPESLAAEELADFVSRPGYRCATGPEAPPILAAGRIVAGEITQARAEALELYQADRPWAAAILARMKPGQPADPSLPTLREVEASAGRGALTTSMRIGWQIAHDAGLIAEAELRRLITQQLDLIERELVMVRHSPAEGETLSEMLAEYRAALMAPRGFD